MAARNKLTAQQSHIWTLRAVIVGLILILLVMSYATSTSVDEITVNVPPDLSEGYTGKAGDIPNASVYSFTSLIFKSLHEWEDGSVDFSENIKNVSCLLTPEFVKVLEREVDVKRGDGELDRRRHTKTIGTYSDELVAPSPSNDSWVVWYDVNIIEHIDGLEVKNAFIRYPLAIERDERQCNAFGMAIAGYAYLPTELGRL